MFACEKCGCIVEDAFGNDIMEGTIVRSLDGKKRGIVDDVNFDDTVYVLWDGEKYIDYEAGDCLIAEN